MMASGMPLVQAFEIIGSGHENAAMQKLIMAIKANVEGGSSLAEALGKHPLHFDDLFVNLVEAGEQAGALETLLDKIATYKEKTEAIKKKIKKALIYPGGGSCRRFHRDDDSADFRDPGVRRPVPGLWRGSANVHAHGHRSVCVRQRAGIHFGSDHWCVQLPRLSISRNARGHFATSWTA